MAVIIPDEGLVQELTTLRTGLAWRVGLFKANITPSASTVAADVVSSNECSFTGYARVTPTWGTPAMDTPGGVATMTASGCTFTRSSTGTTENAYGWFLLDNTSGKLLAAERFSDAPKAFTNAGDSRSVTPTRTHDQA